MLFNHQNMLLSMNVLYIMVNVDENFSALNKLKIDFNLIAVDIEASINAM